MFDEARLRLTAWYLAILGLIVGVLSFVLYLIIVAIQDDVLQDASITVRAPLSHVLEVDSATLAGQIVGADLAVLVLAAIGAWILAGRTLRPIALTMERQRRFAAAASHELRTPLTALRGNLEVALLRRRSAEEYEQIITEAVEETERMGQLVQDLMMLARTDGDIALVLVPTNLSAVAQQAVEDMQQLADRKGQTILTDLPPNMQVRADPMKLRQAITNLLENAVTYTPQGGVISIAARRDRGHVSLEIRDTGIGIPREHLPSLFEPFYQVDPSRSVEGHIGLGLALAAWIVRAHHGQIQVASREGVGSVFTVSLVPLT